MSSSSRASITQYSVDPGIVVRRHEPRGVLVLGTAADDLDHQIRRTNDLRVATARFARAVKLTRLDRSDSFEINIPSGSVESSALSLARSIPSGRTEPKVFLHQTAEYSTQMQS